MSEHKCVVRRSSIETWDVTCPVADHGSFGDVRMQAPDWEQAVAVAIYHQRYPDPMRFHKIDLALLLASIGWPE